MELVNGPVRVTGPSVVLLSARVGLSEVGTWRVIYYAENVAPFQVVAGEHRISDSVRDGFFEVDANWSMKAVTAPDDGPRTDSRATQMTTVGGGE